jgi:hypothetical protein
MPSMIMGIDSSRQKKEEWNMFYQDSFNKSVKRLISLLCLIQKINQLQNEIIRNRKNYIKNFCKIQKNILL